MENRQVKRIVEAAILAAGQPLSQMQLAALFGESEPIATEAIAQALAELREDYAERGVELVEVASGFRFQVRQDVHAWVSRLWTERQSKYSRALLETLSLIAYRQPITRAEIEQIRGVAVSTNIVRTLEEREWVRVLGHRDVPGKPALYGTTRQFLDYFNLRSLDQLPALAEIRDIEEFEPELELSGMSKDSADAAPSREEFEPELELSGMSGDATDANAPRDELDAEPANSDGESGEHTPRRASPRDGDDRDDEAIAAGAAMPDTLGLDAEASNDTSNDADDGEASPDAPNEDPEARA